MSLVDSDPYLDTLPYHGEERQVPGCYLGNIGRVVVSALGGGEREAISQRYFFLHKI